jgi:hypothetical protein
MDFKKLEQMWEETLKEAFDSFIEENIGYKTGEEGEQPACYGTGDEKKFCLICPYVQSC